MVTPDEIQQVQLIIGKALADNGESPTWSADEIADLIEQEGAPKLAAAFILDLAAARLAASAESVKTFDLDASVDSKAAADALFRLANLLRNQEADETTGDAIVVPFLPPHHVPELTEYPWRMP